MSVFLYHATSSAFAEDIIKNGFSSASVDDPYKEFKDIFSKYVNKDILTDEFFDKYRDYIQLGTVSSIGLRTSQVSKRGAVGPFAVEKDFFSSNKYMSAPEYGHAITKDGAGELESGVLVFLNKMQERLKSFENETGDYAEKTREVLEIFSKNVKPEFVQDDGTFKFESQSRSQNDLPILIKIKLDSYDDYTGGGLDCRIKDSVAPEQIEGIAFLPIWDTRTVPEDMKFYSKEEFLDVLKDKQSNPDKLAENYVVYDPQTQKVSYALSFLGDDKVLEQKFSPEGNPKEETLYQRDGMENKGKIYEKIYNYDEGLRYFRTFKDGQKEMELELNKDGSLYRGDFYEDNDLKKRLIFKDGQSEAMIFFEDGENIGRLSNTLIPESDLLSQIPVTNVDFEPKVANPKVQEKIDNMLQRLQENNKHGIVKSFSRTARIGDIENAGNAVETRLANKKFGSISESIKYMQSLKKQND